MAANKKSQSDIWLSTQNPIRGLTRRDSEQIMDSARRGNEVRLQQIYAEIERAFPVLSMVVDRRSSSLLERDWKIGIVDAKRVVGFDETLANQQAEYLESIYGEAQNNGLYEAIDHLCRAFFRGYSCVGFEQNPDGSISKFTLYDNVNFVREPFTNNLYWNPSASQMYDWESPDVTLVPEGENIVVQVKRAVDYPLIHLFLMYNMGKQKYGQFLEKFGIPPVILSAPEGVGDDKIAEFTLRAQQIFAGGSGVVGNGTSVSTPSDGFRGQDPFTPYLSYVDEQVVLLATGSTLGSLTGATGMGSGVAESQSNTYDSIIARDALTVAGAINKVLTKKLLNDKFPGQKHLAYFDFNFDAPDDVATVLDYAVKAKQAGLMLDPAEVSEKTGLTVTVDTNSQAQPTGTDPNVRFGAQDAEPEVITNAEPEDEAPEVIEAEPLTEAEKSLTEQLQLAFGAKFLPLADEFGTLASLSGDAQIKQAKRILSIIDDMPELGENDAMAQIIEQIMATYFGDQINESNESNEETK